MRLPHNRGGLRTYLIVVGLVAGYGTPASVAAGTPLLLIGIAMHLWAKGCLHQEREVTAAGPYRYVRHPFYLANASLDFGIAVMSGWWLLELVLPVWWLFVYVPTMREEEATMMRLFPDTYPAYRARVPLLIPHRRPLARPANGFSWRNGNLWRTEFPRTFRFLSYPLLFLLVYRFHSAGAAILRSPTATDVTIVAACLSTLSVGRVLRRHFKHRRPTLPAFMAADAFRLAILIGVIAVGTCVVRFEVEAEWAIWPPALALLGLSVFLRTSMRGEPVLAEAPLAVALALLFELVWMALLLVPLYLAIALDGRLEAAEDASAPARPHSRPLPAYRGALVAGVLLSIAKELWS
jgi:Phospholipid methyltransferase